jgi:hypothetical protein
MNQLISRWVNWRQGSREEPGDESADQQVGKLKAGEQDEPGDESADKQVGKLEAGEQGGAGR